MLPTHHNELADTAAPRCRFRKLRISWSVAWGLPCILLIMRWARSYTWYDSAYLPLSQGYAIAAGSIAGNTAWRIRYSSNGPALTIVTIKRTDSVWPEIAGMLPSFSLRKEGSDWAINTPHWLPVTIFAVLFASIWIRKRFTLRGLLITTTMVAVVLRLIVWLR
jgi:hypothetical protein